MREANEIQIRRWRTYGNCEFGQVHFHVAGPVAGSRHSPLLCLHSTPYSGVEFESFQRAVAVDRLTICADTPGFGASDRPDAAPTLQEYAAAIYAAVGSSGLLDAGTQIDVLGLHTGAVLATEIGLQQATAVRKVVLSGLPLFSAEDRAQMMARYVKPVPLLTDHDFVANEFRSAVLHERPLPQHRRLSLFVERLRSGADAWWAARAVFGYELAAALRVLPQASLLLVVADPLAAQSRRAAELLRRATLVDIEMQTTLDAWDLQAELLASLVREFLDRAA